MGVWLFERNIPTIAGSVVYCPVIQDRGRGLFTVFEGGKYVVVMPEQGIDQRNELPGHTPKYLFCPYIFFLPRIVTPLERQETLVKRSELGIMTDSHHCCHIKNLAQRPIPPTRQFHAVDGGASLPLARRPAAIPFEVGGRAKIGDRSNMGDDGCRLDWANCRDGQENFSFAGIANNCRDLSFEICLIALQKTQFCNQLLLLQKQAVLTIRALDANTLTGELLQQGELLIGWMAANTQGAQVIHARLFERGRSWEMLAVGKCVLLVGVLKDLGKFWEQFITNRGQAIEMADDIAGQLFVALHESVQAQGKRRWWNQWMQGAACVVRLNTQLHFVVELPGQDERIAFVTLLFAVAFLVNMQHVARDSHLKEILQERKGVMAGMLYENRTFSKWGVTPHPGEQFVEALSALLEAERGTRLNAMEMRKQRAREKARIMRFLPNINSHIQFHHLAVVGKQAACGVVLAHLQISGTHTRPVRGTEWPFQLCKRGVLRICGGISTCCPPRPASPRPFPYSTTNELSNDAFLSIIQFAEQEGDCAIQIQI